MITKVKNLKEATHFKGNFEYNPNGSSGLTFAHFGGTVHNSGVIQTIAAGTVTLPSSGTVWVYIDVEPATAVMAAAAPADITSVRWIPLYQVSGGVVTDMRNHTTSSLGTETGTAPTPP